MATIRSLAPEMLADIFEYLTKDTMTSCLGRGECDCASPTLCSAALVCRAWRPMAQSALFGTILLCNFLPEIWKGLEDEHTHSLDLAGPSLHDATSQALQWHASPARARYHARDLYLSRDIRLSI